MIQATVTFDMAHRCPGSSHGEDSIHGHTWTCLIEADIVDSTEIGDAHWTLLSIAQTYVVEVFDKGFLVYQQDDLIDFYRQLQKNQLNIFLVDFVPTASNFAHYLFRELEGYLREAGIELCSVVLNEGPRAGAIANAGVIEE